MADPFLQVPEPENLPEIRKKTQNSDRKIQKTIAKNG